MTTTRRRVARKVRKCGCDGLIGLGDVYLEHVVFPGEDCFEEITRPWRLTECADCATRYGRAELLNRP